MPGLEEWSSPRRSVAPQGGAKAREQNSAYGPLRRNLFGSSTSSGSRAADRLTSGFDSNRRVDAWPLSRHRRRRVHRLASGRGTAAARRDRAHRRQFFDRPAREPADRADVELVEGDLADPARRASAPWRAATYVLHQAAIPSVPRSVKDPVTSHRANVDAHAAGAAGRARRRRQARRLRRIVVGLRRHRGAAEARGHAAAPAVALRAAEAGRRAVLPAVHEALRPRDRRRPATSTSSVRARIRGRRTPA